MYKTKANTKIYLLPLLLAVGMLSAQQLYAQKTIKIKEMLGLQHQAELVSYQITPEKGECRQAGVKLAFDSKPVAAQLSDIEYWPGDEGFVKSAKLSFVVNGLEPLETKNFTLTLSAEPVKQPGSNLTVTRNPDNIEMRTPDVGVRLPLGNGSDNIPSPITAMRIGDGAWSGGSEWTETGRIKEWSSEITENGPVFARVSIRYVLDDDTAVIFNATLVAGDNAVRWDMEAESDNPDIAVDFRLPPVPGVSERYQLKGYGQWARDRRLPLQPSEEAFASLAPDSSVVNIFPEYPAYLELAGQNNTVLRLHSRFPGRWVDPAEPFTYGGFPSWNLDMVQPMWKNWQRKAMPVYYAKNGVVSLRATLAKGERWWLIAAGEPKVGEKLNRVKDMVLDWKRDAKRPHPRGLMDAEEIAKAWKRAETDPDTSTMLAKAQNAGAVLRALKLEGEARDKTASTSVAQLRTFLAQLGRYDVMRKAILVATLYDTIIDSPLISAEDKALFRAQMAFLGYRMADPGTWSIERGFCSGNPNMSISYTLSLGVIACVLSDHPMAGEWAEYATRFMNTTLENEVGENGEWLPEGSHYGQVSFEPLLTYAVAAKKAGYHDFTNDPRLKKLALYFAKYNTPRDKERGDRRFSGHYGRGTLSQHLCVFGIAAKMTEKTDPEFSKTMQWLWSETGYTLSLGDARFGGLQSFYMDRTLPMKAPQWKSELFPELGVLLRAAFNTPYESQINFISNAQSKHNLDIWTPGIGAINQWFGLGAMLSTCFSIKTGYADRHELLRDGVRLARNWGAEGDPKGPFGYYSETKFGTFAAFPETDYARTTIVNTDPDDRDWFPNPPPGAFPRVTPAESKTLEWTRQLLFMKDTNPEGPAYIVLRDTTRGGEPTAWQFWTLSEKLGAANEAADVESFLADAPGKTLTPARELPQDNRYTALGQEEIDVEFFIASPAKTPRHTLRYGGKPVRGRSSQYQDMLHLQLPGDGAYFVVLYPRPRGKAAPEFAKIGENGISVKGDFGTDLIFMSENPVEFSGQDIVFTGTAGAVRQQSGRTMFMLGGKGEIRFMQHGLSADSATTLAITENEMTVRRMAGNAEEQITVRAPGNWMPADKTGITLTSESGVHTFTMPVGIKEATLKAAHKDKR